MAVAIHVPRVNNNDDEVKLVELRVGVGDAVIAGQIVAAVETDKAVVDVEAPANGHVLAILGERDALARVGSVLIWLGATDDEAVPTAQVAAPDEPALGRSSGAPTAKALALLRQYGLDATDVDASGARLSAEDVRRHVISHGLPAPSADGMSSTGSGVQQQPRAAGSLRTLQSHERGMLHTVRWQRDAGAVPGYLELAYDAAAWERHAAAFGQDHQMLLNPLLPLMAWRLVQLAVERPKLNATLIGEQRYEFSSVNLGFTVQAGEVLYLAVVTNAAAMDELGFVQQLIDIQRRAAAHQLTPSELQGATLGFSSMSRWKVQRHVPVLAPHTALMVAHTVGADGVGILGASYDHRVLHGGEVAMLLAKLGRPPRSA